MKILVGDILQSKAQTLVNTVNCVGIMGKGIALEFKNRFPEMFDDYAEPCERKEVKPEGFQGTVYSNWQIDFDYESSVRSMGGVPPVRALELIGKPDNLSRKWSKLSPELIDDSAWRLSAGRVTTKPLAEGIKRAREPASPGRKYAPTIRRDNNCGLLSHGEIRVARKLDP